MNYNEKACEEWLENNKNNIRVFVLQSFKDNYVRYLTNILSTNNFKGDFFSESPFTKIRKGSILLVFGVVELSLITIAMLLSPVVAAAASLHKAYRNYKAIQTYLEDK